MKALPAVRIISQALARSPKLELRSSDVLRRSPMKQNLARLLPTLKTGNEPLHCSGKPIGVTLLDFWRWNTSDIVSNSTRGALAEFIVANALGALLNCIRDEWQAFDLKTPDGITVEVKSAAFIQSWSQREYSRIQFNIPKTRAWNADTNLQELVSKRQARVYVFALLAYKEKSSIDPLNLDQWQF